MVRERDHVDAACGRAADDIGRREQAVGARRVAVEVVVEHRAGHPPRPKAGCSEVSWSLGLSCAAAAPRINFAAFHDDFNAAGRSLLICGAERATICQWYSKTDPENPLTAAEL